MMKKITLLITLLSTGLMFSQTVLLDGGTSGTSLWDETFGQGPTYQNPVPTVSHTSVVDAQKVVLIEKATNNTAAWHLVGCRKNGDTSAGVNIDGTNYIIQLKFRTNKDTDGSISVQPFNGTEVSANYVGNGGGTGTTTFGSWQLLSFDLSADNPSFLNRLDIRIDGATTYTSPFQFEIDDMIFGDSSLSLYRNIYTKLKVSPNPVNTELNLSDYQNIKSVSIYNLIGQKVKKVSSKRTIDVSELTTGVYILKTDTGATSKFVKK